MDYTYEDRKPIEGDIVEYIGTNHAWNTGELYIVQPQDIEFPDDVTVHIDNNGATDNGQHYDYWKVVKTLPGFEVKIGDSVIVFNAYDNNDLTKVLGNVYCVTDYISCSSIEVTPDIPGASTPRDRYFKVLCKTDTIEDTSIKVGNKFIPRTDLISYTHYGTDYIYYPQQFNGDTTIKRVGSDHIYMVNGYYTVKEVHVDYTQPTTPSKVTVKDITVKTDIKLEINEHKTDLEKKLPYAMVVYTATGSYESIHYNKTKKGVLKRKQAFLQLPDNLGKHVTIHKCIGEYSTLVPVVKINH